MGLSVIKVLSGFIDDEGKLKLNLQCETIMGRPSMGEAIYAGFLEADNRYYEILEVANDAKSGILELVVYIGGPEFEQEWRDQWKPRINLGYHTAICWLTMKQARELPFREMHQQFVAFVELHGVETITRYVDEKFKPSLKFNIRKDKKVTSLSKSGGLPLATPGFQFPRCEDNEYLVFICQVDFQEIKSFITAGELNGDGILYVFGTLDEMNLSHGLPRIILSYSEGRDDVQNLQALTDHKNSIELPETGIELFERANLPQDDRYGWRESNFTQAENDLLEYLDWILSDYGMDDAWTLFRPDIHVSASYHEWATRVQLKLTYEQSLNSKGQVLSRDGTLIVDYGEEYITSFEWRHLFDFILQSPEKFSVDNNAEFKLPYNMGYTLMIPQKDLDALNFNNVVLIPERSLEY